MVSFGLWYDFRNPDQWRRPLPEVYAEMIEQVQWAERLGYDFAWTTEHHFVADDYSSSILTLCAAIAARTERLRVGTSVLLLPLHNPVRVAEDAATVDVLSAGRLDLGVAIGYRLAEFSALGIESSTRGRRMDEAVEVLLKAWASGAFKHTGEFYRYEELDVRPKPAQVPMPLWFGGLSRPAVRRAAKFGSGFMAGAGPDLIPYYLQLRAEAGLPPGQISKGLPFVAVTNDPDAAWVEIGPHVQYQRQLYATWLAEAGTPIWQTPASPAEIRAGEPDIVVTPERARAIVQELLSASPQVSHLYFSPVPPGLRPSRAAESIRLFISEVAREFRS